MAIGRQAARLNTTGCLNIALGWGALESNTTGCNNIAIGRDTLASQNFASTSTTANVAIGAYSLADVTTGSRNTVLGVNTGRGVTTGLANTIVGSNVTALAAGLSNNIIIADGCGSIQFRYDGSKSNICSNLSLGSNLIIDSTGATGPTDYYLASSTSGLVWKGLQKTFNRRTASYTLVLSDAFKVIEMNLTSSNTVTIPTNASASFATGTFIDVIQYGAGQTSFTASGVTLRSTNDWLKINARYGAVTLLKVDTNEWYIIGNLNA